MEAHLEGNPCPLVEMFIYPQEMMDILLKAAIQAEITQVLMTQEIMHHLQEIILTVIMVIPVHVMTSHQEAIVIEMDMVGLMIIQIIQVEDPTEIHMRVMAEDLWSLWSWSADLFTVDKAGSKRNQMLRVVEAEEC